MYIVAGVPRSHHGPCQVLARRRPAYCQYVQRRASNEASHLQGPHPDRDPDPDPMPIHNSSPLPLFEAIARYRQVERYVQSFELKTGGEFSPKDGNRRGMGEALYMYCTVLYTLHMCIKTYIIQRGTATNGSW